MLRIGVLSMGDETNVQVHQTSFFGLLPRPLPGNLRPIGMTSLRSAQESPSVFQRERPPEEL